MDKKQKQSHHPMWVFVIIFLIFLIPFLLAKFFISDKNIHYKTTNYGYLIQPPIDITELKLYNAKGQLLDNKVYKRYRRVSATRTTGKWLLLTINTKTTCDIKCAESLYKIRQIRIATGKNQDRIQRAILTFNNGPHPKLKEILRGPYRGTYDLSTNYRAFAKHVARIKSANKTKNASIYLVDPLGNMMMLYGPDAKPMKLLKDLNKLLKVSQIG